MFEISRLGAIGVFQNKNDGSDVLSKCNTIISNYKNSFKSFFLPSIVFLSEISKNSNLVHLHPLKGKDGKIFFLIFAFLP